MQASVHAKRREWWQDPHIKALELRPNHFFHQQLKPLPILLCRPHSQGQECEVVKGPGRYTCCPHTSQLHP